MFQNFFDMIILLPSGGVSSKQIAEETYRVATSLGVRGRFIHNERLYEVSLKSSYIGRMPVEDKAE